MRQNLRCGSMACMLILWTGLAHAEEQVLSPGTHHLRFGSQPEWSDFADPPEARHLELQFRSRPNPAEWALGLRQEGVRQTWKVTLNSRELGRLVADENLQQLVLRVPANVLKEGDNRLTIQQTGDTVDDIRVAGMTMIDQSLDQFLSGGFAELVVLDESEKHSGPATPCRLTILDARGALAALDSQSSNSTAVRTGVVYSGNGQVKLRLSVGHYTVYAGRGLEYSMDSAMVEIKPGGTARHTFHIRREVPTAGWVSCDTHIHTLTHSGHGDCTDRERMLTIAGEGIELPIATDHNVQIDYQSTAREMAVGQYFTPVVGNEVTTPVGHFNVFPLAVNAPVPDHKVKDWKSLFDQIVSPAGERVIVLNHARDVHSGFRPFGPEHHVAVTGENIDGWDLRANAMEVVNSGAQQSDPLQLVHDWMGLLNRGMRITPIGSSDSHDVSRYIVGQGRTYIRCRDDQPGEIPVKDAIDSLLSGRVSVSCGLLAMIEVNGQSGPGDLVTGSGDVIAEVRVLGPHWIEADHVALYANGELIREAKIAPSKQGGVKARQIWELPRFAHDVHLVAVASGPGVTGLYWPIARPYQATSPVVNRRVMSITGAVWIDGDGDGKWSSAADYARRLRSSENGDVPRFIQSLKQYDVAVSEQAASVLHAEKISTTDPAILSAAKAAGPHVERGFQTFNSAWRDSEIARRAR